MNFPTSVGHFLDLSCWTGADFDPEGYEGDGVFDFWDLAKDIENEGLKRFRGVHFDLCNEAIVAVG